MLGHALAARGETREDGAFGSVDAKIVSSGRVSCRQTDLAQDSSYLADFALDVQDELARLSRMGTGAGETIQVLSAARVRSLVWYRWE